MLIAHRIDAAFGIAVPPHYACALNAASGVSDRTTAAVSSRVEGLHTSFISQRKGGKPESTLSWFACIHCPQTGLFILFKPWPTKRRKLTRKSRIGKILSTTRGRGNSSGARRVVGVSHRFLTSACSTPLKNNVQNPQRHSTTCTLSVCFVAMK